ncbi:MAG: peptidylprolyl isomerase, partial [Proteobacteria bacterium]
LVAHDYEARDVLRLLEQGKSFEEMAKRFSICPSAKDGGSLGAMKTGRADPDFEEAALLLKPGQRSKTPVKTRFGYHIILRN